MNPVGMAANEAVELIVGNILIAVGGIILGFLFPDPAYRSLSYTSAAFFGAGIIFDVRVLSRFSHELHVVKGEINTARLDIQGVTAELKHQERVSNAANEKLNKTIKEIEEQKAELKEVTKKTFSRFSHAQYTSVEDMVMKTFDKLDERLRRVEEKLGMAGIWGRLRGSQRPY